MKIVVVFAMYLTQSMFD